MTTTNSRWQSVTRRAGNPVPGHPLPSRRGSAPARGQTRSRLATHQAYSRWRARQIAYGRWQPWADAAPVRDHVRVLRRHGVSYQAIAQAAGVSPMTVHHLLNGRSRLTGQIPHRVGSAQASRLLAVSPPAVTAGRRDACGTRRRLQGLVALGHCPAELARQAGMTSPRMRRLLAGQTRRVSPALHAAIADLYDQMWNRLPSEQTPREQTIADAARRRAEAAGWPPPMALDDDKIDDPGLPAPHRLAARRRPAAGAATPGPAAVHSGSRQTGFSTGSHRGSDASPGRLPSSRQHLCTARSLTYELHRACPDPR